MKQVALACLGVIILLAACHSKPKGATIITDDGKTKVTVDPAGIAEKTSDMTEKMEELKKLTPLTLDQLKAMIPEELMGMKRSDFNATSAMGAGTCSATYKGDDGKQLKVVLIDGAGEAGASLVGIQFYSRWNFEQQDDNGYAKTVDFNGSKAIEKYTQSNDEYNLTYVANDRLLVNLEGQKMGLDGVKDAAKNLNLK